MSKVLRKSAWKVGIGVLGGLCLAAGIATAASSSSAAQFKVDHQLCYTAAGKFKIPVTASGAPAVRLKNQFSPDGFVPVIRSGLAFHCNPVTKTIQTPSGTTAYKVTNPAAHLACLPMTAQTAQPTTKVVVTNQFGSATLVTRQPNLLCLPSWKGLTGPPMKTPTTPPGLSHFTCYPVGVASGAYKPPAVGLRLKDEFSAKPVAVTVNPMPQELCVPTEKVVGKRDYKILDPATHLLCFGGPKTPIKPKVWDENQFGTSVVYIRATKWLCVPSTMIPSTNPSGYVYWVNQGSATDDGTVNKVPIGGGSVTTLASQQNCPDSLAVNGTDAYWANYCDDGTVKRTPLGGGSVTTLASGQTNPRSVAVDATHVYWVNALGVGTVNAVPLGGGSVTTLAGGQSGPGSLAVDGTHVYWTNNVGGTVNAVPIGGGSVTTLASGQNGPASVVVDGTHVYWVTAGLSSATQGEVRAVPLGGGSVTTLATGQTDPGSLAVDGTHVYWAQYINGVGTVTSIPVGGGSVTTLASGQNCPISLALGGTHVYWANYCDGTVKSVPLGGGSVTTLATGQHGPISVAVVP